MRMQHGLQSKNFHDKGEQQNDDTGPDPCVAQRIIANQQPDIDSRADREGHKDLPPAADGFFRAELAEARRQQQHRRIEPEEDAAVAEGAAELFIEKCADEADNHPKHKSDSGINSFYVFFLFHFSVFLP